MITTRTTAARLCAGLLTAAGLSACSSALGPAASSTTQTVTAPAPSSAVATSAAAASVVVSKGATVTSPTCSHSSCAHVTATTAGFTAAVTCAVANPDGTFGVPWQQGASETKESPNFYGFPGTTLTVTCTGDGRTSSGSLTW